MAGGRKRMDKIGDFPGAEQVPEYDEYSRMVSEMDGMDANEMQNEMNGMKNGNEDEVPDFVAEYEDSEERAKAIDKFLGKPPAPDNTVPPDAIILPMYGSVKDYAKMLHTDEKVVEAQLNDIGIYACTVITQEAGQLIVEALRPNTQVICEKWIDDVKPRLPYENELLKKFPPRRPVICVLGHVDHGKTTLLDYLRKSHVADQEAGGITQSIGAFVIDMPEGCEFKEVVMFDTPGHAAFTGMRQRGANVVDLAILMVAATDGVQPQTRESLAIIRKEKLPFIVAINKIDRPEADVDMVVSQLSDLGVFRYETEFVEISAKKGTNVSELLETIDVMCDLQNPRGDPEACAQLVVFEAKKSRKEGTIVNALVQDGTLRNGDCVLQMNGYDFCKVGRLMDFKHVVIETKGNGTGGAGPSTPVSFLGFKDENIPAIGSVLIAAKNIDHAKQIIEMREKHKYFKDKIEQSIKLAGNRGKMLYNPTAAVGGLKEYHNASTILNDNEDTLYSDAKWVTIEDPRALNIWIRADCWGSVDALENFIYKIKIPNDEYYFNIVSRGVGSLTLDTVREADNRNCFVVAFNIDTKESFTSAHRQQHYTPKHLKVFQHNVIFSLFEQFIEHFEEQLQPDESYNLCGRACVKEIFHVKTKELASIEDGAGGGKGGKKKGSKGSGGSGTVTKNQVIAGLVVESGKMLRDGHFKILRFGKVIYEQLGASDLKHFAISVTEIEQGDECGLRLEYENWDHDDIIECYEVQYTKKQIDAPLFELDPELQNSLYSAEEEQSATMIHEEGTVYSTAGSSASTDDNYDIEFKHPNESRTTAPKVSVSKKQGKFRFEEV